MLEMDMMTMDGWGTEIFGWHLFAAQFEMMCFVLCDCIRCSPSVSAN